MRLDKLQWRKEKPFNVAGIRLQNWEAFFNENCQTGIGIDPGKNFGIAVVDPLVGILWSASGTFENSGLSTFWNWRVLISEIGLVGHWRRVAIEGASYNERFGQVELAEIRLSIRLAFHLAGFDTIIVPPQSIRKQVFGSAKIRGQDIWPTMNKNAADSVPIALVAGGFSG